VELTWHYCVYSEYTNFVYLIVKCIVNVVGYHAKPSNGLLVMDAACHGCSLTLMTLLLYLVVIAGCAAFWAWVLKAWVAIQVITLAAFFGWLVLMLVGGSSQPK
jgi:hypothetical protein